VDSFVPRASVGGLEDLVVPPFVGQVSGIRLEMKEKDGRLVIVYQVLVRGAWNHGLE